jgi:hypothetical protein
MAEELKAGEMAALLGTGGEKVTAAGRDLTVRPFTLAQLAEVLEVLDRMAARGALSLGAARDFNPLRVLLRGGRDVLDILRIATGAEAEWLGGLDAAEGAKIIGAVWRINSDFFTRNRETMLEALRALGLDAGKIIEAVAAKAVEMLAVLLSGVPSSSSSPADTGSKTSKATPSGS